MADLHYYRFLMKYLKLVLFKRETVGRLATRMARSCGTRPFLLFEDESQTFQQFNEAANRRADVFLRAGFKRGDVVALLMENRPEYLETYVGLAKLGVIIAHLNTHLSGSGLQHCLETSAARAMVVGSECLPALRDVLAKSGLSAEQVYVDTRWPGADASPAGAHDLNRLLGDASAAEPPRQSLRSDDLLCYIYTSGTTGLPKAAKVTHYRFCTGYLGGGLFALKLNTDDVLLCPLPLYHSSGLLVAFASALGTGARFVILREFSASRFWQQVRSYRATCFIYIGELLRYLVNQPPHPEDGKHQLTQVVGNGLRPDIWPAFKERFAIPHIREFYGATEGNIFTVNLTDAPGSIGTVLLKSSDNTALARYDTETEDHIRGADGFILRSAPGEAGEILGEVKKLTPFQGYTNKQASNKKLLRDVFKKGDCYFRSGDLLKQDAAGHYYFVDRLGDTFRWKGENVSTQEVQEVLSQHPDFAMVNVVGVHIPNTDGRAGLAAVVLAEGRQLDAEGCFALVHSRLPAYAQPAFIRITENMEVTGTFKLKKVDLQTQGFDPAQVQDQVYYRDDANRRFSLLDEQALARIKEGALRF